MTHRDKTKPFINAWLKPELEQSKTSPAGEDGSVCISTKSEVLTEWADETD